MTRDPRITAYIDQCAPFARPILKHLRKVIYESGDLDEAIKWGMPSFLYKGNIICGIAGFKAHCALWFWKGKTVVGKKPAEGMGNFGRITNMKELPSDKEIKSYIAIAKQLKDEKQLARPRARPRSKAAKRRP